MSNKPAETKKPFFSCCSAEEEKKEAFVDLGTKTYSSPPSTSPLTQSSTKLLPSWLPPRHNPASASPTSPLPRRTKSSPLPTSLSSGRDINNLQPLTHPPAIPSPPAPSPFPPLPPRVPTQSVPSIRAEAGGGGRRFEEGGGYLVDIILIVMLSAILRRGGVWGRLGMRFSEQKGEGEKGAEITKENAQLIIDKWVKENKVVLFMKGTPLMPLCGYSNFVVELLKKYGKDVSSQGLLSTNPSTCWTTPSCERRSRSTETGPPSPSSTSTANSSAAATSSRKCTRTNPCRPSSAPRDSSDPNDFCSQQ